MHYSIRDFFDTCEEIFDDVASNAESSPEVQPGAVNPGVIQVSWSRMAVQSQGMIFDASRLSGMLREQADAARQQNNILIFALMAAFVAFLLTGLCLYWLLRRWCSIWTAWGVLLLFTTQPVLLGHAFINPKDPPFMVLFLISLELGFRMADHLAGAAADERPGGQSKIRP